jgi:hypothetical protein
MEHQTANKMHEFQPYLARINLGSIVLNNKSKCQEAVIVGYHFYRAQK